MSKNDSASTIFTKPLLRNSKMTFDPENKCRMNRFNLKARGNFLENFINIQFCIKPKLLQNTDYAFDA
jgi:hypothetical protein